MFFICRFKSIYKIMIYDYNLFIIIHANLDMLILIRN